MKEKKIKSYKNLQTMMRFRDQNTVKEDEVNKKN